MVPASSSMVNKVAPCNRLDHWLSRQELWAPEFKSDEDSSKECLACKCMEIIGFALESKSLEASESNDFNNGLLSQKKKKKLYVSNFWNILSRFKKAIFLESYFGTGLGVTMTFSDSLSSSESSYKIGSGWAKTSLSGGSCSGVEETRDMRCELLTR